MQFIKKDLSYKNMTKEKDDCFLNIVWPPTLFFRLKRKLVKVKLLKLHANLKKNAHESCELSFIGRRMMTITLETVFQIALRNCSQEAGGKVSIDVILVKGGKFNQAHIFLQKVPACHQEQSSP